MNEEELKAQRLFRSRKFLGKGCYSYVFSVTSTNPYDRGKSYALKRYFPRESSPLYCAKKEYNILKRITLDPCASSFLPKLYYAFAIHDSPALVITEAMGITIDDIVKINGPLTEVQAKFYLTELVCGLKYLHSKSIVHLELKSNNILIAKTGHTLIVDFDRSYDLMESDQPPMKWDFIVNLAYAAPEIASRLVITDKADIWSLGVLTAFLIGKFIRPKKMDRDSEKQAAIAGRWEIDGFSSLSRDLQDFFTQVFIFNYLERPSIESLQSLAFFKDVNWNEVEQLRIKPPFSALHLRTFIKKGKRIFPSRNPTLLRCLFSYHMPKIAGNQSEHTKNSEGQRTLVLITPVVNNYDLTREVASTALRKFNFIHPLLNYRRLLLK
ncbi:unnamed protein product [Rodentolepis nana]|uniref:Protein kinase domain-containing protein n=1 Tax=Rodentolepis nana TaxID=102285 RepID=A0A0R3TJP1_RODNA|nr:unnamed protein product [Rodentolepis nana]